MLNDIPPDRLILLTRHAESEKNIQDYHGHSELDHPLTEEGLCTARKFGRQLRRRISVAELVASGSLSARQTALAIAESHNNIIHIRKQLHAVCMGIIAGKTDAEVNIRFPHIHKQLREFQDGRLHPKDLDIPGRESFLAFATRIYSEMQFLSTCKRPLVVTAHHSSLNMLLHVIGAKDAQFETGSYKRYILPNLSVTIVEVTSNADKKWQIRAEALHPDQIEEW